MVGTIGSLEQVERSHDWLSSAAFMQAVQKLPYRALFRHIMHAPPTIVLFTTRPSRLTIVGRQNYRHRDSRKEHLLPSSPLPLLTRHTTLLESYTFKTTSCKPVSQPKTNPKTIAPRVWSPQSSRRFPISSTRTFLPRRPSFPSGYARMASEHFSFGNFCSRSRSAPLFHLVHGTFYVEMLKWLSHLP